VFALFDNTTGGNNTANGVTALISNTTGFGNVATGFQALHGNTMGGSNTAIGATALQSNTTGGGNTAIGSGALFKNTTGASNTALGISAGSGVTTSTNVICIGTDGANVNNSCFIGNIHGVTTAISDAIPVVIDSAGQLGTMSSSYRFKKDIATMEKSSEAILSLRPVTFHYKTDTKGTPQFGLIAEEVAKVSPDLVVRDKKGEIYTVRYDAVNAMLPNEFLKQHRKNEEQQSKIEQQEATIVRQQKQIEALAAGVQKVSAQLEVIRPAPQTALNNP
jgi:Chaperone of endosialidase